MKKMKFTENEIPYGTLEEFGLTHEMIEDLPMKVLGDILDGRRSPVLPIQLNDEAGALIKSRTRFQLVRQDEQNVDILFYPELEEADLDRFNEQERGLLQEGKSIIVDFQNKEGNTVRSFVQLDRETNQVLSVPTPVIGRNLQLLSDDLNLSSAELNSLQKGEPVTFTYDEDDEPISVGIDLNERTGLRFTPGDGQMWNEQRTRDWDKYTFGVYGCWTMDDDGNLDYVKEEDYTEDMWNEQKKAGLKAFAKR